MKQLLVFLCVLSLSCSDQPKREGKSLVPEQKKLQEAQTAVEENSVLGGHFRFARPPKNLLIKRAEKTARDGKAAPPLTGKHVGAVYDLVEFSLQTQLTEAQKKAILEAVIIEYEAGGDRQEGVLSAPLAWVGMEQVYRKAQNDAIEAKEESNFLEKQREDFVKSLEASPDYPYRNTILSVAKLSEEALVEGPPVLTKQHVGHFIESLDFMISVYLGKPFEFLVEDREILSSEIVKTYQRLPERVRNYFGQQTHQPDFLWTLLRAKWDRMDMEQRKMFRKSLIDLLGYPVVDKSMDKGVQTLLNLPEDAISRKMRKVILPRLQSILVQYQDLPPKDVAQISYIIYDY